MLGKTMEPKWRVQGEHGVSAGLDIWWKFEKFGNAISRMDLG